MNAPKRYRLLQDRFEYKAGTVVYPFVGTTYGLVGDDERHSREEHKAVTLFLDGDYPFFTVPAAHLEEIPE